MPEHIKFHKRGSTDLPQSTDLQIAGLLLLSSSVNVREYVSVWTVDKSVFVASWLLWGETAVFRDVY